MSRRLVVALVVLGLLSTTGVAYASGIGPIKDFKRARCLDASYGDWRGSGNDERGSFESWAIDDGEAGSVTRFESESVARDYFDDDASSVADEIVLAGRFVYEPDETQQGVVDCLGPIDDSQYASPELQGGLGSDQ